MLTKAEKEKLCELIGIALDAECDMGACTDATSREEVNMVTKFYNTALDDLWEFIDKEL